MRAATGWPRAWCANSASSPCRKWSTTRRPSLAARTRALGSPARCRFCPTPGYLLDSEELYRGNRHGGRERKLVLCGHDARRAYRPAGHHRTGGCRVRRRLRSDHRTVAAADASRRAQPPALDMPQASPATTPIARWSRRCSPKCAPAAASAAPSTATPGVFARVPHKAIAQARAEGFEAHMEAGVSAEDCLYADLGIDPGEVGCQQYEASQFMFTVAASSGRGRSAGGQRRREDGPA